MGVWVEAYDICGAISSPTHIRAYIGQQCVYAGLPLGVDTPAGSPAEYLPEPELNVLITSSWLAKQVED